MYRLIVCLLALLGFGLGSAWALLQPKDAPAARLIVASASLDPAPAAPAPMPPPDRLIDPASVGGYSGTAVVRAGGNESTQTARPSAPASARSRARATDEQLSGVALALSRADRFDRAMECMDQVAEGWQMVPASNALAPYPDWKFVTRFQREPDKLAPVLFRAFDKAAGVARQSIIFQVALALPERICLPWLNEIRAGADAEDSEDALCALAFRGDSAAMSAFEQLSLSPTTADCRVIADSASAHDRLAAEGKRALLRSYRCIEMLDCKPYFWQHSWSFGRDVGMRFPWADEYAQRTVAMRYEAARRLLPHWIKRFDGHPGSDDMAWRLCLDCQAREEWLEAARWASRCATFPDQDMTQHGVNALVTLAEARLERWQIDQVLDSPDFERNRTLLQYIRLRRAAAHEGFETALREAAVIGASEGESQIGRCFASRWNMRPADGLESGLQPLPAGDPLRRREASAAYGDVLQHDYLNPSNHWRNWSHPSHLQSMQDNRRLYPPPEAVRMSGSRLARQFRLWETMAELERRRDAARNEARADLEYKLGAIYYHEPDVIYPCYARHVMNSGLPHVSRDWWPADELDLDAPERAATFRLGFASLARAAQLFTALADTHPNWPGRDKALFSAAMAHIKLASYRPFSYLGCSDIPIGTALFEQLIRDHPQSTLSDDAQRAATYWRREGAPKLFG